MPTCSSTTSLLPQRARSQADPRPHPAMHPLVRTQRIPFLGPSSGKLCPGESVRSWERGLNLRDPLNPSDSVQSWRKRSSEQRTQSPPDHRTQAQPWPQGPWVHRGLATGPWAPGACYGPGQEGSSWGWRWFLEIRHVGAAAVLLSPRLRPSSPKSGPQSVACQYLNHKNDALGIHTHGIRKQPRGVDAENRQQGSPSRSCRRARGLFCFLTVSVCTPCVLRGLHGLKAYVISRGLGSSALVHQR